MRAVVIVTCTVLVACGRGENCFPGGKALQCESEVGIATIAAPAGYGAPTFLLVSGRTCVAEDGTCSLRPSIGVIANFNNSNSNLGFWISLPAREGAATYAVSPSASSDGAVFEDGHFAHSLDGVDMVPVIPLSGTIVVEHSTTDAFLATFDLELESPDQRFHFSITGGSVEDAGCRIVSYGPSCQPAD